MLVINSTISIPLSEFDISYARSPGPGGQNVNKVNSKVILRWDVTNTKHLPPHVRQRFLLKWRSRITKTGHLVINSHRFRDQPRNYADCMNKLREMIRAAMIVPQKRKFTKPTAGSKRRRLEGKKRNSQRKQNRRSVREE
jgi:ribosome-associated protein